MKRFHLITLFEDACEPYLSASILGRARKDKRIEVKYQNPRDFIPVPKGIAKKLPYKKVDDRPYGGGPGMVMQALPVVRAVTAALRAHEGFRKPFMKGLRNPSLLAKEKKAVIVWFTPGAKQFTNKDADALLKYDDIAFVCGRYEGIDERAKKILRTLAPVKTFAVGEAVYTGGEVPALAMIDAITRRIPGVLGKDASVEERRIAAHEVYTRPEAIVWKGKKYAVPRVLLTGHHLKIESWRGTRS